MHDRSSQILHRFATSKYKEPSGHNTSNMFMHLTNYSVNKHSRMYIIDDEMGSKRSAKVERRIE
jgi:tubulin polyglutamylase TTLL6/13